MSTFPPWGCAKPMSQQRRKMLFPAQCLCSTRRWTSSAVREGARWHDHCVLCGTRTAVWAQSLSVLLRHVENQLYGWFAKSIYFNAICSLQLWNQELFLPPTCLDGFHRFSLIVISPTSTFFGPTNGRWVSRLHEGFQEDRYSSCSDNSFLFLILWVIYLQFEMKDHHDEPNYFSKECIFKTNSLEASKIRHYGQHLLQIKAPCEERHLGEEFKGGNGS